MANTTLVQMRLRPETISEVTELQELLGTETRVGAIKLAIATALMVVRALANKKVVSIENDKGEYERILIPGVGGARELASTKAAKPDGMSEPNTGTATA